MKIVTRVTQLLEIEKPIIQAGMIWCSGWELASAVSNAGGLGIIGAGSMYPDVLKNQIQKCKAATNKPFAVNVPLLYSSLEEHLQTIVDAKVPIVFTSAGNPKLWTKHLQSHGCKVVHVVSSAAFAAKCESVGCDAIVAEGFEAGGHNGREETTTLCLIPNVRKACTLPLIAAGGIACGASMLAALALGAEAVQVGTRFVASYESSAHQAFKNKVINSKEGDTLLALKKLVPVRLLKNNFFDEINKMENACATVDDLVAHLGRGRAKKGMFEGDLDAGELEIGQAAANFNTMQSAESIVNSMMLAYEEALNRVHFLSK